MLIRLILGFILAYLFALVGVPMARRAALDFGVVDRPDGHLKTQKEPIPYLGGLAVFVSFLLSLGMIFELDSELLALLLTSTIVATLGLIDDFGVLTPKAKVIGQLVAIFVLIRAGIYFHLVFLPLPLRIILTILWLVGLSNAINLMDIMDGLGAGVSLIAASFLLVVASLSERWVVAAFTVALIGALLGFLRFNFPPARIYLGDTGSLFLGFSLGALAMVMDYTRHNPLGWVAPLFFLALPLVDTVFVSVLRIKAGRKIYYGSPDHFPLRLRKRLNGSTTKTLLWIYTAALLSGGAGILCLYLDARQTIILVGAAIFSAVVLLIWLAAVDMEEAR